MLQLKLISLGLGSRAQGTAQQNRGKHFWVNRLELEVPDKIQLQFSTDPDIS